MWRAVRTPNTHTDRDGGRRDGGWGGGYQQQICVRERMKGGLPKEVETVETVDKRLSTASISILRSTAKLIFIPRYAVTVDVPEAQAG
eukprot:2486003-Prymnesium_polylepis.1